MRQPIIKQNKILFINFTPRRDSLYRDFASTTLSPFPIFVNLKIPLEDLDLIPIEGLGELREHSHAVRGIVVLVFTGDGVRAKHIHHSAVVVLFLIEGLVLEEAMLLHPSGIEDNLRFFIARCKFGGNLRDATIIFYRFLNILCNSAPCIVMLKTGHLDTILQ